jgi:hypothetical protein
MTSRPATMLGVLEYTVGNEHDPGDPWGRSILVIQPDGRARLEHHFSRRRETVGAWTGRVDAAALESLWSALRQAGFPAVPSMLIPPGAAPRQLSVTADGQTRRATVGYHEAAKLPGYAEAFQLLDAVCHQVSEGAVSYPDNQPEIVHDACPET